ncbi:MAG: RNA methyltransferase, partial [Bacteroidales bacterium]|nr:RNA methyltransferase [Bacteroidales bacterium]
MNKSFPMIAKTFQGLEEVLANELTQLGALEVKPGRRMVSFSGDKKMLYQANFNLRTATRILVPIHEFTAEHADEVYEAVKSLEWSNYLDEKKTFAIDSVVFSDKFRHSKFVAYRVKDAIVDHFIEQGKKRPSVRLNNPDLYLNIHIANTTCTLSL